MMHSIAIGLIFGIFVSLRFGECDRLIEDAHIDKSIGTISDQLLKLNSYNAKEIKYLLSNKNVPCCACTNSCVDNKSGAIRLQNSNLFDNNDKIQNRVMNRHIENVSRDPTATSNSNNEFDVTFIDNKSSLSTKPKKRFELDMSASIRNFVTQLRPQTRLSAYGYPGYNGGLGQLSYAKYSPIANSYNYRPFTGNLGLNYGLDSDHGYSDFTPFVSAGLGSSLGTPYGTGLGIGSSFGIYDNIYPNSYGVSKSTMLRRKLVPSEGVLLLEVEDSLNEGLPHDTFSTLPLTSGRHVGLARNGIKNLAIPSNQNNFGRPKFSIQLSSNSPVELNSDGSSGDLAFYSNQQVSNKIDNQIDKLQPKPNLTKENLVNFDELSKNPHRNRITHN